MSEMKDEREREIAQQIRELGGEWADKLYRMGMLWYDAAKRAEDLREDLDAERKRVQELQKERDKAKRSREHTWDWITRHYGKLEDWARKILPEPWQTQFFNCVANGSYHVTEDIDAKGQTNYFRMESAQEQLLYDHMTRAENSEERVAELEGALRDIREDVIGIAAELEKCPDCKHRWSLTRLAYCKERAESLLSKEQTK